MAAKSGTSGPAPGKREIDDLLGKAAPFWTALHADLCSAFGPLDEKWRFSRQTNHWSLQLTQRSKKRTVLYLIALPGLFQAAFALGEKACAAARASALPASVVDIIEQAPRYPEGRGVRLDVRSRKDVEHVKALAAIKMAN
jgi:hypothetical protein